MDEPLYLIVCLRHTNMLSPDLLLFWGPERSGYVSSVYNAGLYTQADIEQICDDEDIPMPIEFLGLDPNNFTSTNEDLRSVVYKSDKILKFIDREVLKAKIRERLKRRKAV